MSASCRDALLRQYAFAQRSALLDWLQSPDCKFVTISRQVEMSKYSKLSKQIHEVFCLNDILIDLRHGMFDHRWRSGFSLQDDTLALALVTVPAAVPSNVTVALVLARSSRGKTFSTFCCSSETKMNKFQMLFCFVLVPSNKSLRFACVYSPQPASTTSRLLLQHT